MIYPFEPFKIDQKFGDVTSYGFHGGIDINGLGGGNTDLGTPLKAIYPGIVTSVHNHTTGFGKHLHYKISGPSASVWSYYAHSRLALAKQWDTITEDQVIAEMGST